MEKLTEKELIRIAFKAKFQKKMGNLKKRVMVKVEPRYDEVFLKGDGKIGKNLET